MNHRVEQAIKRAEAAYIDASHEMAPEVRCLFRAILDLHMTFADQQNAHAYVNVPTDPRNGY